MFRVAAWVGLVTLSIAVALLIILPTAMGPLPDGMETPIIAFELARSPVEVEAMFGPPATPERARWVRAMDRGNAVDHAFLVAYGAYIAAFGRALGGKGSRTARGSFILAIIAALADALENAQLFAITARLGGTYDAALAALAWATWIKWAALAVALGAWAPRLLSFGAVGHVAAVAALSTAAMTAIAAFARGLCAELMALGVTLTMIATLVIAVQRRAVA